MGAPNSTVDQNLLPVQAYFDVYGNFQTFIGQGKAFTATISPIQSGLTITNSTLDSSPIGSTSPSTGVFTNIATTTGTISTNASSATDIVNFLTLQSYAAGLTWKNPVTAATLTNITLSGTQTVDGVALVSGNTVLVKNQTTSSQNGIYQVNAGAWTYATGSTTWNSYVSALVFVEYGTQLGSAWYCTAQPGGTLGTTAMVWSNFSVSSVYTAGTGLTLSSYQFSITNTSVAANTYGSGTATPVFAVNAQGQITSVTNTTITPAIGNVTGLATGMLTFLQTPTSANLAATVTDETGSGALVFNTSPTFITPALGTPASGVLTNATGLPLTTGVTGTLAIGNGGTGQTTASAAFNALSPITTTGDLIYGSGANTSSRLAIGSTNQVLTVVGGVPTWSTPASGGVTTFSAGTTGLTPSTATSGAITLAGTLAIANGGTGITSFGTGVQTALGQNVTGSGGIALATSPSFTTPNLGTPSAATLTNATGLPVATGISGLGTGVATALAVAVGSAGAFVTNGGALGTPSSGVATNLTGTASGLSIGGNAATATTATTATNATNTAITDNTSSSATWYPTIVSTTTGNLPQTTSSTKLSFVPSTGTLTATAFSGLASSATNLAGGAASQIPYQTGSGATTFLANGTTGQVLTSNGASAPTWSTPSSGMVYPGAGIPNSTGSAWGTSYTTSGSGTVVALATNPTLTGFIETVYAVTGTTPALSPTNGTIQTWTLSGASTPTAGTWTAGASLSLQITASTNTITWSSMPVTWMGGTAPTLSTTVTTNIELWKIGTTIYGALVGLA